MKSQSFWIAAALCVLAPGWRAQSSSCPTDRPHTLYSRSAADIENDGKPVKVLSPDHRKFVTAAVVDDPNPDGLAVRYQVHVGEKQFEARLHGWGAELSWSPDSSAFAVTQTEGGGGLGYRVYVFYVASDGIQKVDVSQVVESATGFSSDCEIKVFPNTALVRWLGSQSLLIAAETVPVSICNCAGMFTLFEVRLPDLKIEHQYSQKQAKIAFLDSLGCELRSADDHCASPSKPTEGDRSH
jgi:hypothetical protein